MYTYYTSLASNRLKKNGQHDDPQTCATSSRETVACKQGFIQDFRFGGETQHQGGSGVKTVCCNYAK